MAVVDISAEVKELRQAAAWQLQIDDVMDQFNFDLVQKCMQAANWTWKSAENGVPSVYELRKEARHILRKTLENGTGFATGGFFGTVKEGTLMLEFCLDWAESEAPTVHDFATRMMEAASHDH